MKYAVVLDRQPLAVLGPFDTPEQANEFAQQEWIRLEPYFCIIHGFDPSWQVYKILDEPTATAELLAILTKLEEDRV